VAFSSSRARYAAPLLCGLIGEAAVIPGRAVDEFANDVGLARVPSHFDTHVDHDLLQSDLLPLRRPPRN